MSIRRFSIHQIIKEPRISTLINCLMAISTLIIIAMAVLITSLEVRSYALKEAEAKANLIIARNLAIHAYFAKELKPSVYPLLNNKNPDYFDPAWMSSTYAVREIDALFQSNSDFNGYYYKEAAFNARNPKNEADSYERDFLIALNSDPNLQRQTQVRLFDGQPYFMVMSRGEILQNSCLACHSTSEAAPDGLVQRYGSERSFNRTVGETLSAVSIRIPLAKAYGYANSVTLQIALLLLLMNTGVYLTQRLIVRRLVIQPLNSLRDKALQIAKNDQLLGEQIALPAGWELKDLAAAFNTLSSSLRMHQDTLEERIDERTQELSQSQRLIQNILDMTPTALILLDTQIDLFIYANSLTSIVLDIDPEDFKNQDETFLVELVHPEDRVVYFDFRRKLDISEVGQVAETRLRLRDTNGVFRWIALRGRAAERMENGMPSLLLFTCDDITEEHYAEEYLRYTSLHDGLTGLYNRAFFNEMMEKMRFGLEGKNVFPLGIMIMDVDNLKMINDTIGHQAGDDLLRKVAGVLTNVFRDGDFVARIGGDEFAALLPRFTEPDEKEVIARVHARLQEATLVSGMRLDVLSMGMYIAMDTPDLETAYHNADQAMYAEKQRRKSKQPLPKNS